MGSVVPRSGGMSTEKRVGNYNSQKWSGTISLSGGSAVGGNWRSRCLRGREGGLGEVWKTWTWATGAWRFAGRKSRREKRGGRVRWRGDLGRCSRAAQSSWRCGWSRRRCSWKMRWSCGWWKGPMTTSCCNGVGAMGKTAEGDSQVSCGHPHPPRGRGRWYWEGGEEDSYSSPPTSGSWTLGGGLGFFPRHHLCVAFLESWECIPGSAVALSMGQRKGGRVLSEAKYLPCRFSWGRGLMSVRPERVAFRLVTRANSQLWT